jgi:hypothetical protein
MTIGVGYGVGTIAGGSFTRVSLSLAGSGGGRDELVPEQPAATIRTTIHNDNGRIPLIE